MSDLLALLKETRAVLARYWFSNEGEESYNNDDVIAMSKHIDAAITELEAEPERKCGMCCHYYKDEMWCRNQASPSYQITSHLSADWFCADWKPKEQK